MNKIADKGLYAFYGSTYPVPGESAGMETCGGHKAIPEDVPIVGVGVMVREVAQLGLGELIKAGNFIEGMVFRCDDGWRRDP